MTVKEAASTWGLSERRIINLCNNSRIAGARKQDGRWIIPDDAIKPVDQRIRTGAYARKKPQPTLPMPIGISDYRLASTKYYYIDKTMLIKDFLDEIPQVSLFTRPRRFGKTLNMDMLRTFFEKTGEDTSVYFTDKKIWSCGEKYREHQGKYPVIFISFKDVKYDNWTNTFDSITRLLREEFERHNELLQSEAISSNEKSYYNDILNDCVSESVLSRALLELSRMLDEHYGVAPIIIIDEYDTPIQQGHICGFYDRVILFMRNLFSGGLKDNKHLSYGFLTGILRVARESIFSGLNNLKINSILDNKYSEYFGFTPDEIREMTRCYGVPEKYDEICTWYDGYRFGKTDIFNPWSVINYFSNECEPRTFWQSTGSNAVIGEILSEATEDIFTRLNSLLQGEKFLTYIDTDVIYPQIKKSPFSVYSFLLMAGYLKLLKSDSSFSGDYMCEVALPNKEIKFVYQKEILQKLAPIIPQPTAISIQEALYLENAKRFQTCLQKLLLQSASCFDTVHENFYHGLILGMCALMDNNYYVTSNRESGMGRYDIQLLPKNNNMPGILIELKHGKNHTGEQLKKLSEDALQQIYDNKYDMEMMQKGITKISCYGVAFSGKSVEITANLSDNC